MGWRINLFFAWYDLWIGLYWDRSERTLYICPLPCVVIRIVTPRRPSDFPYDDPRKCHWGHNLATHATYRHQLHGGIGKICTRCGVVPDGAVWADR